MINCHASTVFNGRAQLVYILLLSVCVSVRYRFSRQPLNRLLSNLAGVFDMMSERQLSILVSNGCIINDLLHKLCVGRSVTSDRYKKPKLRRHNALVSLHFNPTSNKDFIFVLFLTSETLNKLTGCGHRATGDKQSCVDRF